MLEKIERENNNNLALVTIEITERVIKKLEKPENFRIIMKVIEKLEKEPETEEIARKTEFNELQSVS